MTSRPLQEIQVWFYLPAVGLGVGLGVGLEPDVPDWLILTPLALLLYATFVQVPLTRLPGAVLEGRFMAAAGLGNFFLIPAAVWALSWLVPPEPAILLGLYMVLLVPCTDWFIVFSHLGRGDAKLAIASTPLLLLTQFVLLPLYLWLFMGETFAEVIRAGPFLQVFMLLIGLPLVAAALTQRFSARHERAARMVGWLEWLPVPALAIVLMLIAAAHAGEAIHHVWGLERIVVVFALYPIVAAAIGIAMTRQLHLSAAAGRTLTFSLGTRNSFVVLPFVLALPDGWEMAGTVVVLQPLVELLAMLGYLRILPRCNWLEPPQGNVRD